MGGERDVAGQATETTGDHAAGGCGEPVGVSLVKARLQHGAPPVDIADAIANHPRDRDAILTFLHHSLGNGYVQKVVAALADPKAARADPTSTATTDPATSAQQAIELVAVVESALFPAYRRAVDALDPAAALELACRVVQAMRSIEHGNKLVATALAISPDALELKSLAGLLGGQLQLLEIELMTKIGPQYFRGAPIVGALEMPHPGASVPDFLASEAGTMVELLSVVKQVNGVASGNARALTPNQRQDLARLVEPWHGRPANFAFLASVLKQEGVWSEIANEETDRETLAKTEEKVGAQRRATGALADIGDLDAETLRSLLEDEDLDAYGEPAMSEDRRARHILEGIVEAPPAARGALIRQIHRAGHLPWFCEHVPRLALDELNKSMIGFDADAAVLLNPYTVGQGGGRSMREIYKDQVDHVLEHNDAEGAYATFVLERLHNLATFGFEGEYSAAYEENAAGATTHDQFQSDATKALGKAAVIGLVSSLTGTATGAFGEGLAAGSGASESAAQIIGAGFGGFGAGVGGHLAGDVYDQTLNGKQGFDSVGSYMQSGAEGGIMGTVLGGLSVAAGKYLGGAARPIDTVAEQHPKLATVLERIRGAGLATGKAAGSVRAKVRMTVSELIELLDSGFAISGGDAVTATNPGLRALPPTTEIEVSLRPMEMSEKGPKHQAGPSSPRLTPDLIIDDLGPIEEQVDRLAQTKGAAYEDAKNGGRYAEDLQSYRERRTQELLKARQKLTSSIDGLTRAETDPERLKPYSHDEKLFSTVVRGVRSQRRQEIVWRDIIEGVLHERGVL